MRYVLLDRVTSMERGASLTALKIFPLTDESLNTMTTFQPTVPTGLLIEAMAQAGGVLMSSEDREEPSGLVFAKIERANFLKNVYPGQRLEIRAEVLEPGSEASRLFSTIMHDGDKVGEMTYFLARRSLQEGVDNVDGEAFKRAHNERGAVLGVRSFLGGES